MDALLSSIISSILQEYIDEIDSSQLRSQLLKKSLELHNVSIKATALMHHGLPVEVAEGKIGSIRLKSSKPYLLEITDVTVLGRFSANFFLETELETERRHLQQILLPQQDDKTIFSGFTGTILNNLKFSITNVHIKIEHGKSSIGLILPRVTACTVDAQMNEIELPPSATIIRKKVSIENLSIYLDPDQSQGHQYILHEFSVVGSMIHSTTDAFSIDTESIKFDLNAAQWAVLAEFDKQISRFRRLLFYCPCGRPADDEEDRWVYLHNCTQKQRFPLRFNPDRALIFLKARHSVKSKITKYLSTKESKKDQKMLTRLGTTFGDDIIVMFLIYHKYRLEHEKTIPISASIENELTKFSDSQNTTLNFKVNRLEANLSNIATIAFTSLLGVLSSNKQSLSISATLDDMAVNGKSQMFSISKNQDQQCASFQLTRLPHLIKCSFDARAPHILFDPEFILQIQTFFGSRLDHGVPKSRKRNATPLEIDEIIREHSEVDLKVHFDSPEITTQNGVQLLIGTIDLVSLPRQIDLSASNYESFYDNFLLNLSNFQANVNSAPICDPISVAVTFGQSCIRTKKIPMKQINFDLHSFSLSFTHDQFVTISNIISIAQEFAPKKTSSGKRKQGKHKDSFAISGTAKELTVNLENKLKLLFGGGNFNVNSKASRLFVDGALGSFLLTNGTNVLADFGHDIGQSANFSIRRKHNTLSVSIQNSKPKIIADLDIINWLIDFFDVPYSPQSQKNDGKKEGTLTSSINSNDFLTRMILHTHPEISLDLKFESPLITFPKIGTIDVGCVTVTSLPSVKRSPNNIQSFYDNFLVSMNGISVKSDDRYLLEPINASLEIHHSFVPRFDIEMNQISMNMGSISICFSPNNYQSLVNYFSHLAVKEISKPKSGLTSFGIKFNFEQLMIDLIDTPPTHFEINDFSLDVHRQAEMNLDIFIGSLLVNNCKLLNNAITFGKNGLSIKSPSPILEADLVWILSLVHFFRLPPKEKKKQEAHASNDIPMNLHLDNPQVSFVFPGKGQKLVLRLPVDYLDVDILGTDIKVNLPNVSLLVGDRPVVSNLPFSWLISQNALKFRLEEATFNIQKSDYYLMVDISQYIFSLTRDIKSMSTNQSGLSLDLEIGQISLNLEDKYHFSVSQLGICGQPNHLKISAASLSSQDLITSTPFIMSKTGFLCSMDDNLINFSMSEIPLVQIEKKAFSWFLAIFINQRKSQVLDYVPFPSDTVYHMIISLPGTVADLSDIAKVNLSQFSINIELSQKDIIVDIDLPPFSLLSKRNTPFDSIFTTTDITKLHTTLKSVSFIGGGVVQANLQVDVLLILITFMMDLFTSPIPQPINMPPIEYNIFFEDFTSNIFSTKFDRFLRLKTSLQFVTTKSPTTHIIRCLNITVETSYKVPILTVTHLEIPVEFDLKKSVPDVFPDFVPDPLALYLHGISMDIKLQSISMVYDHAPMLLACSVLKQLIFAEFPKSNSPFTLKPVISASIGNIALEMVDSSGQLATFTTTNLVYSSKGETQSLSLSSFLAISPLSSYPLLTIHSMSMIIDGPIKLTLSDTLLYFDFDPLIRILNTVIPTPLKTLKKVEEQPKPLQFSLQFEKGSLVIPIEQEFFFIDFGFKLVMLEHIIGMEANQITAAFGPEFYGERFNNCLSGFSFEFQIYTAPEKITYLLATQFSSISLSAIDIASLVLAGKKFSNFMNSLCYEKPMNQSEDKHLVTEYKINIDPMEIIIARESRLSRDPIPLLRLMLQPLFFSISTANDEPSSIEISIHSIDFMNQDTGLYDMIVEPLTVFFVVRFGDPNDFNIMSQSRLNINLAHSALRHIVDFSSEISKRINEHDLTMPPLPYFRVKNDLGCDAQFAVDAADNILRLAANDESEQVITDTSKIALFIGDQTLITIPKKLYFPQFLTRSIVCYTLRSDEGQTVVFSSLLQFKNLNEFDLYVIWRGGGVLVPKHSSASLPIKIPSNQAFKIGLNSETRTKESFTVASLRDEDKIKNFDIPVHLHSKFARKRKVMVIEIDAICIIENQLPLPIFVESGGNLVEIKPNSKSRNSLLSPTKPKASFKIGLDPQQMSSAVTILTKAGYKAEIPVYSPQNGITIHLCCDVDTASFVEPLHLVFYAPAVIFNKCSVHLQIVSQTLLMPGRFFDIGDQTGLMLWGDPSYFNENKQEEEQTRSMPIQLILADQMASSDKQIECCATGLNSTLLIPNKNESNSFTPFHYTVQSGAPVTRSSIVTIFDQLLVKNELDFQIYLQPLVDLAIDTAVGMLIKISPGEEIPVYTTSQSFVFCLFGVETQRPTRIVMSAPVRTTLLLDMDSGARFIEIEILERGVNMIAFFRPCTIPQPLMIANLLADAAIGYGQLGGSQIIVVEPESTMAVGFENPFESPDLELHILGVKTTIDILHVNKPSYFGSPSKRSFYIEVRTNRNATKSVIVSEEKTQHSLIPSFIFSFAIPGISCSLIDERNREMALVTIDSILTLVENDGDEMSLSFSIDRLQIDDMHPNAELQVAVATPAVEKRHLLEFSAKMSSHARLFTACSIVEFRTIPLIMFIDASFLSDLIDFWRGLNPKTEIELLKPSSNRSGISQIPFSSERLIIYPMKASVSVRKRTTRPPTAPLAWPSITKIPDITDAHIKLPGYQFQHVVMSASYVQKEILRPMKMTLIKQALRLLFSMDILLNPLQISENCVKHVDRIKHGEMVALAQIAPSTALTVGESALMGASKFCHLISFDDGTNKKVQTLNVTAKETVRSGMKSMGKGFLDGATGIILEPIKGAKQKGFVGALAGIGKGVTGLVTKPVTGIVDGATSLVAGARKAVDGDTSVFHRERKVRAFGEMRVTPYDERLGRIQNMLMAKEANQWIEMALYDFPRERFAIITSTKVAVFDLNCQYKGQFPITLISDIEARGDELEIRRQNNNALLIRERNAEIVKTASFLLESLQIAQSIGS